MSEPQPEQQESFNLLDDYLRRLHAGDRPDRAMLVADHPELASALDCLRDGLCVGMAPAHQVLPWVERGDLVALQLSRPFPASPSCVAWAQDKVSPAMSWLLEYLGDTETMNQEWLNGPDL